MDDQSRQMIRNIVARAHDCALSTLQPHLNQATQLQRSVVMATLDHALGYIQGTLPAEWNPQDLPSHLQALINAQTDPVTVQLLAQYSEYLNYFLVYASERLARPVPCGDN